MEGIASAFLQETKSRNRKYEKNRDKDCFYKFLHKNTLRKNDKEYTESVRIIWKNVPHAFVNVYFNYVR